MSFASHNGNIEVLKYLISKGLDYTVKIVSDIKNSITLFPCCEKHFYNKNRLKENRYLMWEMMKSKRDGMK